ncbi:MAG: hypothetical protein IJB15_02315, partial [Clostridia bacterium]|nr:hypothetical protein [Clostridia bacterium]
MQEKEWGKYEEKMTAIWRKCTKIWTGCKWAKKDPHQAGLLGILFMGGGGYYGHRKGKMVFVLAYSGFVYSKTFE